MAACRRVDSSLAKQLLNRFKTFLFDCDGVLWNEHSEPIGHAQATVQRLKDLGKKVYFVTNNSTKTRLQYAERCKVLGFRVDEHEIVCTAWLAATYLKKLANFSGKVYMIGNPAMGAEFDAAGIRYDGLGIEEYKSGFSEYAKTVLDPEVSAVVVGYDPFINYAKVVKASSYLQRPGCLFVGTNCDSYLPSESEIRIPGTGSIIEFVAVAAEKRPVYIGKPEVLIRDLLKNVDKDFDPATTLMIGDRLDTDIRFGHECGFHALLVLTGVNSLEDALRMQASNSVIHQKCVPHYYAPSVDSLVELFDGAEDELATGLEPAQPPKE